MEPEYYDIADDVLNRSKYRYAHLFNTRLLMQKKIDPKADSPVHFLKIRNQTAQKYFDYQLGRIHAVDLEDVRNYENAVSREGRVSVAMDSYFLRFDRIQAYYLGQETFELNRIRAEREAESLRRRKRNFLPRKKRSQRRKAGWEMQEYFSEPITSTPTRRIRKPPGSMKHPKNSLPLSRRPRRKTGSIWNCTRWWKKLGQEKEGVKQEQQEKLKQISELTTLITSCEEKLKQKTAEAEEAGKKLSGIRDHCLSGIAESGGSL